MLPVKYSCEYILSAWEVGMLIWSSASENTIEGGAGLTGSDLARFCSYFFKSQGDTQVPIFSKQWNAIGPHSLLEAMFVCKV